MGQQISGLYPEQGYPVIIYYRCERFFNVFGCKKEGFRIITKSGAYSDQIVHSFRTIPSTCSEGNRPGIPKLTVQVVGA